MTEQVETVNPDLMARDEQAKPYTVRYEAVNAMLLNEFLNEHRRVKFLEATLAVQEKALQDQQKDTEALREALKAQAAQIQKLTDKL